MEPGPLVRRALFLLKRVPAKSTGSARFPRPHPSLDSSQVCQPQVRLPHAAHRQHAGPPGASLTPGLSMDLTSDAD